MHADFLLIGGGLASATAAETLREEGAVGTVLMVCAELVAPYQRPPLSKRFLLGKLKADALPILEAERYRELGVDLLLGTKVIALDPEQRSVQTDRSGAISYGKLLIATGATANPLTVPGSDLPGIYQLRTLADAEALRAAAQGALRVVIVGGSFIGMEAASTLGALGLDVTVIDRETHLFAKLDAPKLSEYLLDLAKRNQVKAMLGESVAGFDGHERVASVRTSRGRIIDCDLVVLGVGVTPATDFLHGSGLAFDDGVVVDRMLRASKIDIFAAGDVARFPDPVTGSSRRVEHWDNAVKQGRCAARNMLGHRRIFDELSYFYCDVFDTSFEVLGSSDEAPEHLERGKLTEGSYALLHMREDRPIALFSMGRPAKETKAIEALIRYRVNLSAMKPRLADPAFALDTIPNQNVLILQGGGAMGAFECGVVTALEEFRLLPDVVAGVSIGALNGAIMAGNPGSAAAALDAFWNDLTVAVPGLVDAPFGDELALWQIMAFGSAQFFRPRWTLPMCSPDQLPYRWTSLYDTSPLKSLLARHVDFSRLKSSPIRLLVSAVDVETAELRTFDSYGDEMTVDHILASASLPPSFPWTTIDGRHYWDGGIVSNSPLDLVVERCGAAGKRIFIVDLYAARRALPRNIVEVLARRDEIVFAERIRKDVALRDLSREYGRLVDELLQELPPERAATMRQRPRYIQLMGGSAPLEILRIVREGSADETSARDFDFSANAVQSNRRDGYEAARKLLAGRQDQNGKYGTVDD